MTDITVKIEVEAVAQCVQRILSLGPSSLGGNPLAKIVAESIADAAPAIRTKVQSILAAFVASPEMERNLRAIYRDAMYGEAARMGRNAARAMVTAKPEGKDGAQ